LSHVFDLGHSSGQKWNRTTKIRILLASCYVLLQYVSQLSQETAQYFLFFIFLQYLYILFYTFYNDVHTYRYVIKYYNNIVLSNVYCWPSAVTMLYICSYNGCTPVQPYLHVSFGQRDMLSSPQARLLSFYLYAYQRHIIGIYTKINTHTSLLCSKTFNTVDLHYLRLRNIPTNMIL